MDSPPPYHGMEMEEVRKYFIVDLFNQEKLRGNAHKDTFLFPINLCSLSGEVVRVSETETEAVAVGSWELS